MVLKSKFETIAHANQINRYTHHKPQQEAQTRKRSFSISNPRKNPPKPRLES
jgi:hypothetical protein